MVRHRFPRLAHDPDVSGQRLEGQGLGFVESDPP